MSALGRHVAEYLALRRSFGFTLEREEHLLAGFVEYSEAAGAENLSSELAIAWVKRRLGVVMANSGSPTVRVADRDLR